CGQGTHLPYSF
nr:immunoglobulin light chain junction region [Macaca mulatta]MOW40875.1 immunoglobulin light chain junction region [Macaca mulatta]MOW42864.1 immunoglobulin light chain junction region [Macaca mulatta]MOW44458.1 immunoglobulin light chain junction region [Macaca mulatta]MOW72797.1 immunoglobulin light chain junction region [Macaca mulatta]